jgi:hypothetical protein
MIGMPITEAEARSSQNVVRTPVAQNLPCGSDCYAAAYAGSFRQCRVVRGVSDQPCEY